MIQVKKYEIQQTVIMLLSLTVILLADLVRAQQAAPYQYGPQPYQNAFNYDRRRVNVPYGSFGGDSIKFPGESSFAPSSSALNSRVHGTNEQYNFNARNKKDMIQNDGTHYDSHVHRSNEDAYVPINVTNGIDSYDDFFNLLDDESRKQLAVISPRFSGEGVERSAGRMATPASCIPEMTVVPLKLSDGSDVRDPTIFVFPPCTRVKRCGGCCTNNLLSCQPMESNNIIFEVYKSQYIGGKMKLLNKELVEVEEHSRCKCDCRKKEGDCTKFQRYNRAQCMCICINIEDKNKCLAESSEKIWDANTCTCRCRESKECSTGTYFDENSCSCQATPGHRHTQQVVDRRRLITKPVIYVPETPETYYDSGT